MATAAQELARFISGLQVKEIPADARAAAALHALDVLGTGLAAYAIGEAPYAFAAVSETASSGPATVIGNTDGFPPTDAAFVNGTLCHALDFDDTHPNSVVHVSAAVVPAALAVAQAVDANGSDLLAAIVAGNETSIRLGNAGGGLFHARGFHPTGVCGVFGATAAAARVRNLDAHTTAQALGIAGSMASGLLEFLADGAETKRLHPGWAAQAGISATRLAAHGASGPATVLEGARGFLAAYLHGDPTDLPSQLATLGQHWATTEIAFKPYPACHYTHAPVDALAQILQANPLAPDDVESIVAFTDSTGASLVCAPAEDKVHPRSSYDAKFSLPYCLAYRLVHGRLDVRSFAPDQLADSTIGALTPRISFELRQYAPAPDAFGGGVRLRTIDGRIFEAELRHQRGGAENPLAEGAILTKFRTNAEMALDTSAVTALENAVLGVTAEPDPSFITLLGRARAVSGQVL